MLLNMIVVENNEVGTMKVKLNVDPRSLLIQIKDVQFHDH